jgi:chorismate dehydratase
MLSSGQLDICPSSSIEFAKHPQKYLILRNLSISSIGQVNSVFLFSRLPIEKLNGQTVGLTKESDTSVNLLKIILQKFYNYHNSYSKVTDSTIDTLNDFSAILLIGDSALREGLHKVNDVYAYDLGDLWYRHTGLPFVFALWIVREDIVLEERNNVINLYTELCNAKHRAYSSFEKLVESFGNEWIGREELIKYWQTISYDLTPHHLEGLGKFYSYSAELGLIERDPQIRLFP